MSFGSIHDSRVEDRSVAADVVYGILWVLWHAIRIPILALLLILEPVVTLVLWGAALLGVLTSLLFEFSGATPDFPVCGEFQILHMDRASRPRLAALTRSVTIPRMRERVFVE